MTDAPLIRLTNITKVYQMGDMEVRALDGVSMEIARGEYVAIMGPSGSGKSTMMNVIGCLDTPTDGTYELNGKLASAMTDDDLAKIRNEEIGFVFQTFNLLARTTSLQNVELPLIYAGKSPVERQQMAQKALENVGLGTRSDHMPNQLSGGQRQRVAIARALVNDPLVLLADKPTGNLDPDLAQEIMSLFERINGQGTTVLVATHDRSLIQSMRKRVLGLDHGRLAFDMPAPSSTVMA